MSESLFRRQVRLQLIEKFREWGFADAAPPVPTDPARAHPPYVVLVEPDATVVSVVNA